jgi:hypothetical protein
MDHEDILEGRIFQSKTHLYTHPDDILPLDSTITPLVSLLLDDIDVPLGWVKRKIERGSAICRCFTPVHANSRSGGSTAHLLQPHPTIEHEQLVLSLTFGLLLLVLESCKLQ